MNVYILSGKKAIVHEGELFVEADGFKGDFESDGRVGMVVGNLPIRDTDKGSTKKRPYTRKNVDKLTSSAKSVGAVKTIGRSDKLKRLDPETKAALIEDLETGDLTMQELSSKYQMTVSGIHYIKKKAGLATSPAPKKGKEEDRGGFIKKNFRCGCGKAFSANTTGEPGEMISCADPDCGDEMLASEGEEI